MSLNHWNVKAVGPFRRRIVCRTEGDWRGLIGKHVSFHSHIDQWELGPYWFDGELEEVESFVGMDPRYPLLYVTGEWGSVVPDDTTTVTVIEEVNNEPV